MLAMAPGPPGATAAATRATTRGKEPYRALVSVLPVGQKQIKGGGLS